MFVLEVDAQVSSDFEWQKTLLCITGSQKKRTVPKKTHPYWVHPNFQLYPYLEKVERNLRLYGRYLEPCRAVDVFFFGFGCAGRTLEES